MPIDQSSRVAGFAAAVHRARESAGLSGRELARRAGLSQSTISRIEGGHDIDWESARRVARALPSLELARSLGLDVKRSARSSAVRRSAWDTFAEAVGFRVGAVTLTVDVGGDGRHRTELVVDGIRVTRGDADDRMLRLALVSSVLVGNARLMHRLEPLSLDSGSAFEIELDEAVHRIRIDGTGAATTISYRFIDERARAARDSAIARSALHGNPFAEGISMPLDFAAERLALRVRFASSPPPSLRPWAWPLGLGLGPDLPLDWWEDLHPAAPRRVAPDGRACAELHVDWPRPGLAYGLAWDPEALGEAPSEPRTSPCHVTPPSPEVFGAALGDARRAAGLSRRALAARLGCSPATLHRLETGSRPTVGQVTACLEALPNLHPDVVLRSAEAPAAQAEADAEPASTRWWRETVALLGIRSREERRIMTVTPEGDVRLDSHGIAFTWEQDSSEDELRLRYGPSRVPQEDDEWDLESVMAEHDGNDEPRLSIVRRGQGLPVHDLRLLNRRGGKAITVVRTLRTRGGAVDDAPPSWRIGARADFVRHVFFGPTYPTERLTFEASLPQNVRPFDVTAWALPRAFAPVAGASDLLPYLHPTGVELDVDAKAGRLRFTLDRPLVGIRYALTFSRSLPR